ncbi:hypothetical protein FOXB_07804, partial [Fusarium oxysporum f. sp. conglutinans Fo5176]
SLYDRNNTVVNTKLIALFLPVKAKGHAFRYYLE